MENFCYCKIYTHNARMLAENCIQRIKDKCNKANIFQKIFRIMPHHSSNDLKKIDKCKAIILASNKADDNYIYISAETLDEIVE